MPISDSFDLKSIFSLKSRRNQCPIPPRVPDNICVYAIGDTHGRLDLLRQMFELILKDAAYFPDHVYHVVFLGDYIDRGNDSKEVIDLLLGQSLPGFSKIYLKGNHETEMNNFIIDPTPNHDWTIHGGIHTLLSYGVHVTEQPSTLEDAQMLRDAFVQAIPKNHKMFFNALQLHVRIGDYFFVHAGVRPGVSLAEQKSMDLLYIRKPFLNDRRRHEKFIVHGHTDTREPTVCPNRIGIDTGAYYSGKLTCLVLTGDKQNFLST